MSLLQRYQEQIQQQVIAPDPGQVIALTALQQLCAELQAAGNNRRVPWRWFGGRQYSPKGLYLWGGVGRGKTFLMDLFFDSLEIERKHRSHFHRFMQRIHQRLAELQGNADPLQQIGKELARDYQLICLDEFFVLDIGDAMLLAGLLRSLFANGVVLVTTSNLAPDSLYANGLQRDSFVPAIKLLRNHCRVLEIPEGMDYRLRQLVAAGIYHYPLDAETDSKLQENFMAMAGDPAHVVRDSSIEILGREISARMSSGDVIWFDFDQLCRGPRSAFDYVEIARLYHAVFLGSVPRLDDRDLDATRRLVNLVDEFYDRRVKLVISAETPLQEIYTGQRLAFEFERCRSRLLEMQSRDYLAQEHLS